MPTVRVLPQCAKPALRHLKGVLYERQDDEAISTSVPTIVHPRHDSIAVPRYPWFEFILNDELEMQETWVTLRSGRTTLRFLIAAQYDHNFPINLSLLKVHPRVEWRGSLLVMLGGQFFSVVNLRGLFHRAMAERAVRKYLLHMGPLVANAIANDVALELPTELQ